MRKQTTITLVTGVLMMLVMGILILSASGFRMKNTERENTVAISKATAEINGETMEITLPYTFEDLQPRTYIVITSQITPQPSDILYMKSVYASENVYVDGDLLYEFGDLDDYPFFMTDAATEVYLLDPMGDGQEITLRREITSPLSDDEVTIHAPIMGDMKSLVISLVREMGASFIFSILQMMAGFLLILISSLVMLFERKGIVFFWLGLFSMFTGIWTFGECNLTGVFIKNPTMLYLFAFMGLFCLTPPILYFAQHIISFKRPRVLYVMSILMTIAPTVAFWLQLSRILPLYKSKFFFHVSVPLSLCVLVGFTLYEALHEGNVRAKRFLLPILILAVSAVLEVINYQVRITYLFGFMFQMGIFLFIVSTGITCGIYVKEAIQMRQSQRRLTYEKSLLEMQAEEQKKRSLLLVNDAKKVRVQRHDLHHQLMVVKELADLDTGKLKEYIGTLIEDMPLSHKAYCENMAVNAVVSHYAAICEEQEIEFETNLVVPEVNRHISDSDLCVIFGNLLENAEEACGRMQDTEKKFIRLNSSIQGEILTITMDNSFNGHLWVEGGSFRSSKRNDFGIGLSSVQAIAKKHSGDARFENEGRTFLSSVYLRV